MGQINTDGTTFTFSSFVIHLKSCIRREEDLPLLRPPVSAGLQISAGHLSKITALTSRHKRQSSYSEPSINVQFSDKSRISISTGRKVTVCRGAQGEEWKQCLPCSLDINTCAQQPTWGRCENTINRCVEMWLWRYSAAPKGARLFQKIKAVVFYGTFWCLMPQ